MREAGLNAKDPAAIRLFIGRSGGSSAADNRATQILVRAVEQTNYEAQAKALYKDTLASYDRLFNKIGDDLAQAPSIDIISNRGSASERAQLAKLRQNSFYTDAVEAHSVYLGRRMQLSEPVYGSYTGTIARRAYYSRFVVGKKTTRNQNVSIALTSTEAFNAGIEVARARGLAEPTTPEAALRLVNEAYGTIPGGAQRPNALGEITLIRGTYQSPRSPVVETTTQRPARRRRVSRQELIQRLLRQRDRNGTPVYTPESAATEAERLLALRRQDARVDVYSLVRKDFTPTRDRKGKPCGKSFIPKRLKCAKPTTARYKEPEPGQNAGTGLMQKVGKVALAAGVAAGGAAAFKNRRAIAGGVKIARNTIKSERAAYNTIKKKKLAEKNAYGGQRYSPQAASRAAQREYIESRQRAIVPHFAEMAIQKLSTKEMYQGLAQLPKPMQPLARNLVGKAKTVAAHMGLESSGMKMVSVNNKHNFATYRATDGSGTIASVGSVGDSLIIYNSEKKGEIRGVGRYGMAFTVDRKFDQRKGLTAEQSKSIAATTKSMFEEQKTQLPNNAFVFNIAYKDDGLGKKRAAVYKRMGFRQLPRGNEMWAIKDNGKFRKLSDDELEALMRILQGRTDSEQLRAYSDSYATYKGQ